MKINNLLTTILISISRHLTLCKESLKNASWNTNEFLHNASYCQFYNVLQGQSSSSKSPIFYTTTYQQPK